ncbi:MAG: hypothetical protein GXP08_18190 [Gammaproteobacteria bacterium]|nr:hypothetical protein [Gammaproteobacteria bacterium]
MTIKTGLFFCILTLWLIGCEQSTKRPSVDMGQLILDAGFSIYKKSISPDKKSYQRPDLVLTGKFNFSDVRYTARFGLVVENATLILEGQRLYDCESLNIAHCATFTPVKRDLDALINNNLATLIKNIALSGTDRLIPNAETITFDVFFRTQHIKKTASFKSNAGANASIVYKTTDTSGPMRVLSIVFPIQAARKKRLSWGKMTKENIIELLGNRTVFWSQYRVMDSVEYSRLKT